VAGAHQIDPDVTVRAGKLAGRLGASVRDGDRLELPGEQQRASSSASRRSLLTRSPGARGTFDGAHTSIAIPASSAAR